MNRLILPFILLPLDRSPTPTIPNLSSILATTTPSHPPPVPEKWTVHPEKVWTLPDQEAGASLFGEAGKVVGGLLGRQGTKSREPEGVYGVGGNEQISIQVSKYPSLQTKLYGR